jgi:hypothetical protein
MRVISAVILASFLSGCFVVVPLPGPTIRTEGRVEQAPLTRVAAVPIDHMGLSMNRVRAQSGKPPLSASPLLMRAAQAHAEDMARTGVISHTGSDGRDLSRRLRDLGCSHGGAAENLAWGQRSVDESVAGWAARSEHRSNMLGPYTSYGSGQAQGYYVSVFARGC